MQRKFTEEQLSVVVKLYKEGRSCSAIARKYDVCHGTVSDALKRIGIQVKRLKEPTKTLPSTEKIAYFAGLLDGEGSMGIYHKSPSCVRVSLYITNTSEQLMKWLMENFGGNYILKERAGTISNLRRTKDSFCWRYYRNVEAYRLLKAALPYLIVKKSQAEYALQGLEMSLKRWNQSP